MLKSFFSIIVSCYNSEEYLGACLESVIGQDYDPAFFEIICVDDGSTDRSPQIIEGYKNRYPHFVATRIENSGLEKACNRGIRLSKYDWIMRVDADDMIARDLLSRMNRALHEKPGYDFYYCKNYVEYYSDREQSAKELPDFDPEEIFSRGDFFATGTVYRKSALAEIGFFPEEIKNCGLENYTVILALLSRKKRGLAVPGASFSYRRHRTNMSTVKRDAIIEYGKTLLRRYGRHFQTNQYHPYGLKLEGNRQRIPQ